MIDSYAQQINHFSNNGFANLRYLNEFMREEHPKYQQHHNYQPNHDHKSQKTVIHFSPNFEVSSNQDSRASRSMHKKCRALYIIEDLSRDIIEELGSAFDIEPQFFAEHLRAVEWEHHDHKSNALMLPSVRHFARYWTLHYYEPIVMKGHCKEYELRPRTTLDMNVLRRIEFRTPHKDRTDKKSVGLVHRVASFWHRSYEGGYFEAVALVDPPLENPFKFWKDRICESGWVFDLVRGTHNWDRYGGGYVDFARIGENPAILPSNQPHRHQGLRADLQSRIRGDYSVIASETERIQSISILLQKIILSNWMLTISLLRRDFSSLQLGVLQMDITDARKANEALNDLMSSRNLLNKCNRMARRSAFQLGINPADDLYFKEWQEAGVSESKLLCCDWTFLIQELKIFTEDTERLVANQNSNVQILDSKFAQDQAKSAETEARDFNRLTILISGVALFFTPLGCAYGILSMGGDFAPGNRKFWVFPAVAIPLVILTFLTFLYFSWMAGRPTKRCRETGGKEHFASDLEACCSSNARQYARQTYKTR